MPNVLVVDDAKVDRQLAGSLLGDEADLSVWFAANGREALQVIDASAPDLVLTDLIMPEMDGLALVEAVREQKPKLPVVLMTAHGNEDIAVEALRRGATSYVAKRHLARDLRETVNNVLAVTRAQHTERWILGRLSRMEQHFVLENDPCWFRPLIAMCKDLVVQHGICGDAEVMRLGLALDEALANALHHGNLEVDSALRESGLEAYLREIEERSSMAPYRDRRIHVEITLDAARATFVVRDEGPGFDPSGIPDPSLPENMERASGRGLFLIRTFMDEVRFNEAGNAITMVKQRPVCAAVATA